MAGPVRFTLLLPGAEHARKGHGVRALLAFLVALAGLAAGVFVYLLTLSILLGLLTTLVGVGLAALDGWRLPARPKAVIAPLIVGGAAAVFIGFVVAQVFVRMTIIDHYHMPSGSMRPTIEIGGRVVVNKVRYGVRVFGAQLVTRGELKRGDMVVFTNPEDNIVQLKRVVGLPGETVDVEGGTIEVDGEPLPEPYIRITKRGGPRGTFTVGEEHYLLLGDNRGESRDSRVYGAIPRKDIFGVVVLIYHSDRGWEAP